MRTEWRELKEGEEPLKYDVLTDDKMYVKRPRINLEINWVQQGTRFTVLGSDNNGEYLITDKSFLTA